MGLTQRLGTIPLAIQTDSSNNVGIGTSTPAERLEVFAPAVAGTSQQSRLRITQAGSISARANLVSGVISGENPYFAIETRQSASPFAIVERLRIDGSGNVGINTSTPRALFDVRFNADRGVRFSSPGVSTESVIAGYQGDVSNNLRSLRIAGDNIIFNTGDGSDATGTERMRITSGGIVYALNSGVDGTYQPMIGGMYSSNNNETNLISTAVSSVASQSGFRFDVSNGAGSTGRTTSFYINRSSVSAPFDLYVGGQGYKPGGGSWANSSDIRLKENVKTIENALDKVLQLRGVTFDWKEGYTENGKKESGGFIADEVLEVFPDWVSETNATDAQKEIVNDDKIKSLSLPFSFDALLVEAIKELSAKVAALENK